MNKNNQKTCAYCSNIEIKNREIVGNNFAWTFPTNIPVVPGHILIVPRRCVAKYEDLTSREKMEIEKLRIKITKALTQAFKAEGFNYAWNENKVAGQSIPHFHLHILPRKKGDKGITKYEPRKFLYRPGSRETAQEKELQEVCETIKRYL
ncbi:HIT domain-containing protein [Candidatus Nomurabacteria bacterium]|nr:HIT domain-containing protein [Candidatus Nomurabacteria bacterium]